MGWNAGHAGILDTQFLPQQGIVFLVLIAFGSKSDSSIGAVGRPTTSIDDGIRVIPREAWRSVLWLAKISATES